MASQKNRRVGNRRGPRPKKKNKPTPVIIRLVDSQPKRGKKKMSPFSWL